MGLIHNGQIVECARIIEVIGAKPRLDSCFVLLGLDKRRGIVSVLVELKNSSINRFQIILLGADAGVSAACIVSASSMPQAAINFDVPAT